MAVLKYRDENGNFVPLQYIAPSSIINSLTSDSEIDALAAKQGKVLNESITNILSTIDALSTNVTDNTNKIKGTTINSDNVNLLTTAKYILPFTLGSAITLGGITLPIYSKGMVITANASGDASLIAIDSIGNVYTMFRNGTNWVGGRMISSSNNVATLRLASRKTISYMTVWANHQIPLDTLVTNNSSLFSKSGNGIKVSRNATLLVSGNMCLIDDIRSGAELDASIIGSSQGLVSRQLGSSTQTLNHWGIEPIKINVSANEILTLNLSGGYSQDFTILDGNSNYLTVEEV